MSATEATFRILVVDDDPELRAAAVRLLSRAGYTVTEAEDGVVGLDRAVAERPDLVLADVVMPGLDGPELSRRIKSLPELAGTLVLLVSGARTRPDDQADGLDAGADGYLARPISNRELLSRVAAMIRIRKAERERDRVIAELQAALRQVKQLRGILPICMGCKRIRDDQSYWQRLEEYLLEHAGVEVSHGLCPECEARMYPDVP
jgi:DNA-binding response OmpR family regulator